MPVTPPFSLSPEYIGLVLALVMSAVSLRISLRDRQPSDDEE